MFWSMFSKVKTKVHIKPSLFVILYNNTLSIKMGKEDTQGRLITYVYLCSITEPTSITVKNVSHTILCLYTKTRGQNKTLSATNIEEKLRAVNPVSSHHEDTIYVYVWQGTMGIVWYMVIPYYYGNSNMEKRPAPQHHSSNHPRTPTFFPKKHTVSKWTLPQNFRGALDDKTISLVFEVRFLFQVPENSSKIRA